MVRRQGNSYANRWKLKYNCLRDYLPGSFHYIIPKWFYLKSLSLLCGCSSFSQFSVQFFENSLGISFVKEIRNLDRLLLIKILITGNIAELNPDNIIADCLDRLPVSEELAYLLAPVSKLDQVLIEKFI